VTGVAGAAAERHRVIHNEIMLLTRLMRDNKDLHSARRWWAVELHALALEAVGLSAGYSGDVMRRACLLQKQVHAAADHVGSATADCHPASARDR
jgi:hypothetical protein